MISRRTQPDATGPALPERIEKIYYSHGLFCSSHPVPVICFASFVIILCCYPLVNLPLPGNKPEEHVTLLHESITQPNSSDFTINEPVGPKWFQDPPAGYILQVSCKTVVSPWHQSLELKDALRASLKQVFDVVEIVRNYQHFNSSSITTLDDICLHITESVYDQTSPGMLPSYGCLTLSPANLWKQDINAFLDDRDVLKSLTGSPGTSLESVLSLKDVMFGIPWKETGVNRFYSRKRPNIVSFAVTLVLEKYDPVFIKGLQSRLHSMYSFSEQNVSSANNSITHIYFHDQYSFIEFIPLLVTYIILFLYIYFSVRKIELVKSKLGMAFSAVVTVIASLCMSVGICTWFGLSFTLKTGGFYLKEIFPYVVVIIGLENILVLTKSVVSTSVHLDVKVRVAQGLSKEGWSITKNLCTELTILTFGFFTFVPAIQEFCLFALVGLLSDFFLQLVFFATILSIDVRRMELSDLQKQSIQQGVQNPMPEQLNHMYPLFRCPVINNSSRSLKKSRSSSRLTASASSASLGFQHQPRVVTAQYNATPMLVKVPKRLRVVYFWARCRIFQRAFMVTFVVWVFLMAYKSGIVEHLTQENNSLAGFPTVQSDGLLHSLETTTRSYARIKANKTFDATKQPVLIVTESQEVPAAWKNIKMSVVSRLHHKNKELWRELSHLHWPTLFGYYNISVQGKYISILPSIFLSIPVDPREAVHLRHGQDGSGAEFLWPQAPDPELPDADPDHPAGHSSKSIDPSQEAIYPSSPQEMVLTMILAIPSFVFVVYMLIVFYRCMCSRNYAEWRSSWSQEARQSHGDIYTQLVLEAMPIVLEGHPQEVECMTTDGTLVVSSCLAGQLRVWDSSSGESLAVIDRCREVACHRSGLVVDHDQDDMEDAGSDYESGSPPSRSDFLSERTRKHVSAPSVLCGTEPNSPSHLSNSPEQHNMLFYEEASNVAHKGVSLSRASHSASSVPSVWEDFDVSDNHRRRYKELFKNEPNLSSAITTDFVNNYKPSGNRRSFADSETSGYDFSQFDMYYMEHKLLESEAQQMKKKAASDSNEQLPTNADVPVGFESNLRDDSPVPNNFSPVWCLDCQDNLIAAGCGDGKIEFWDGVAGTLRCIYDDETGYGVTGVCIVGNRVVAARLHGAVDFLELRPVRSDLNQRTPDFASMHRRTHIRQGSSSSVGHDSLLSWDDEIMCTWVQTARAHQQPITELQVEGGRAVTGSQDHSLKVFRVEDAICQLNLHGHHGPITALFIDKISPMTAASGAQDGAVCLWDLLTGACICRLQGHDGTVAAVTYTAAYVLSAGVDSHLLVWERFQGHLLNTINLQHSYCSSMVMLTDNMLLTARQGSLVVWDIRVGEPVRIVRLGHSDQSTFVRQIKHVGNAIVCDYGSQLRVVQFPTIVEKTD